MEGALPEDIHTAMVKVFEDKQVLGDRQRGGQDKISYCVDVLAEFRQKTVIDVSPIPKGLRRLLNKTRAPFKLFYGVDDANEDSGDEEPNPASLMRQMRESTLKDLGRPYYFYESVWKPILHDAKLWPATDDPASEDQFPPAKVKQWEAARRGKPEPKTSASKRRKLNTPRTEPIVPTQRVLRSAADKIPGAEPVSAMTKCKPGDTSRLSSKRKFDETAIAEDEEEDEEEDDGGMAFEPSDDENDGDYVDDLDDYRR